MCGDGGCGGSPERRRELRVAIADPRNLMLPIAREKLVRTLPRKGDLDVLPRESTQKQEAEKGEVGDRVLEMPERLVEEVRMFPRARQQLVVIRAQPCRDRSRVVERV